MVLTMVSGIAVFAEAEEFKSEKSWKVDFDGEQMNSNFSSEEMAEEIYGILPGDTMTLTVSVCNSGQEQTDWYISNEILKSLEEGSKAEGGAYTYTLVYDSPSGEHTVIYHNDAVGGEGSGKDSQEAGEGLHQADSSLKDFFYLDRLGNGEEGKVALTVRLDGETQGNGYQNTLARLQMNFAAEKTGPETIVKKEKDRIVKKTEKEKSDTVKRYVTKTPKTGDAARTLFLSAAALASGIVLLVWGVFAWKKRGGSGKGEPRS